MKKLRFFTVITILIIMILSLAMIKEADGIENNITVNNQTTEATMTTSETETQITTNPVIKVSKMKVKYKKTMTVGDKQKVKIKKIRPRKATCKKVKIINKTKKILTVKKKTIKAKKAGIGKIVIKSKDGGFKKTIKIKVKNPVPTFEGIELQYSTRYNITSNPLNTQMGVKYFNGAKETYYSQRVLPGGGLKIPVRHVADDGTIRDKDGYIVIACHPSTLPKGSRTIISLGPAKVYDVCPTPGIIDTYVNW